MQDITVNRKCVLCDLEPESHEHIFFSCPYSATVWSNLTAQSQVHWSRLNWSNLLHWAGLKFKGRKGYTNLIAKHTLATTVYFIWIERNSRIFQHKFKHAGLLSNDIASQIRILLLNFQGQIPEIARIRWNVWDSWSLMVCRVVWQKLHAKPCLPLGWDCGLRFLGPFVLLFRLVWALSLCFLCKANRPFSFL